MLNGHSPYRTLKTLILILASLWGAQTLMASTVQFDAATTVTAENVGTMQATLTVSPTTPEDIVVTFSTTTTAGSATPGDDFESITGMTVTIPANASTHDLDIGISYSGSIEPDETFYITINQVTATTASLGAIAEQEVTIQDVEPLFISWQETEVDVSESAASVDLTISLSRTTTEDLTVTYTDTGGTATPDSDFVDIGPLDSITIPAGQTSGTVNIGILENLPVEPDETILVSILDRTPSDPAYIIDSSKDVATVTILDTSDLPTVSITSTPSHIEGTGGTTPATFTLTLSTTHYQDVDIEVIPRDGTATAADNDFDATVSVITFAPGELVKTFTVDIIADTRDEPDQETFAVQIGSINNAITARPVVMAETIIVDDDDAPQVSIASVGDFVTEGDVGARTSTFVISLDNESGKEITVDYETQDGAPPTATAGSDYVAASGTLTFSPGVTAQTVAVSFLGDVLDEYDENMSMVITGAENATLSAVTEASKTIVDDDIPLFSIGDASATEGDSLTFTISLSLMSVKTLEVDFRTDGANNSVLTTYDAEPDVDFVSKTQANVTFPPFSTSQTVTVDTIEDSLDEDDETFFVYLSNAAISQASDPDIDDGIGIGTIIDNDATPSISASDVVVTEGTDPTAEVILTLSAPSGRDIAVSYSTVSGTAMAGEDFTATTGTLTITAGTTTASVAVGIIDDSIYEQPEAFQVQLSAPINVTIDDGISDISINDNEPPNTLVYRLFVTGEGLRDGEWARISSHNRGYLVIDPTRGQATSIIWIQHKREFFPMFLNWHEEGALTIGFPLNSRRPLAVALAAFNATQDNNNVATSYRGRYLLSSRNPTREIGNGETIPAPAGFKGIMRASATNLWPLAASNVVNEFDLLNLQLRARFFRRLTRDVNAAGDRFEDVVESLITEQKLEHSIQLAQIEVAAPSIDPCVLVYRLHSRLHEHAQDESTLTNRRGYVIVDIANQEMSMLLVDRANRQYEVKDLDATELPILQQFEVDNRRQDLQVLGSIGLTAGPDVRPAVTTFRYWQGNATADMRVGINKFADVALIYRGTTVALDLAAAGSEAEDALIRGPQSLRLDRRLTWDANSNGDSVDDVTQQLVDGLEHRRFSDANAD